MLLASRAAALLRWRRGRIVLPVLVAVLFLVGGGFVTMLFGVVATVAASRIDKPLGWWRAHVRWSRLLARLWPGLLIAYLGWMATSWIIGMYRNDLMVRLAPVQTAITPVALPLILAVGFAKDATAAIRVPINGLQ